MKAFYKLSLLLTFSAVHL